MEVLREKELIGNRGAFANIMVCGERVKFSQALPTDYPRRRNSSVSTPKDPQNTVCKYWMSSRCIRGDSCCYLHSWSRGDGFTMLAKLEGHKKGIRGICLPSSSDKLYSGSSDGNFRTWDCNTGQCDGFTNLGDEVSSMFAAAPYVFSGMKNVIKALNIHTAEELVLEAPVGQVNAMTAANTMLVAGTENGSILVWRGGHAGSNPVQLAATMEGHTGAILSLSVEDNMLYSSSMDKTIRVWNTETLQCIKTLSGHNDAVTSVIHCNGHLFSSSLDGTIKVWFATGGQNWEVVNTHNVEKGVLKMCGTNDAEDKPVLLCSCNDNTVRLYEVPTFAERGRLFSARQVTVIEINPINGLFFTGDANGALTVWKWL